MDATEMTKTMKIVVPVWGDAYLDTFLEYSLPAQLAARNVPAVAPHALKEYVIYTDSDGKSRCEGHAAVRRLAGMTSLRYELLESLEAVAADANKYARKSACYDRELESASRDGDCVVMLNADILLAEDFLSEVVSIFAQGKTVIEVTGGRGLQLAITAAIDDRFRAADGTVSITTAELSRLWLANLHPQLMMHFVDGPHGTPFHPSHLYWGVGERGVIIRGFHLYPIAVKPPASRVRFAGTIDDDLVARIGVSWDERFIAQDSRRLFCCELSPAEHHVGDVARREDRRSVIDFYLGYARENVANLRHEIIITDEEELSEAWVTIRAESAAYAEALVAELTEAFHRRDVEREAALAERASAAVARPLSPPLAPEPPLLPAPPGIARAVLRRLRSWLR